MVKGLHTWQWLNIHSFIFRKTKMFCGLIHFLLVNMNCLCISTVKYSFWNSGKTKVQLYTILLSIYKPGVCFFLLSGYGNRFFFKLLWEPIHEKRGVKLFMCAYCVLRFMCGKDVYSRLYFQTGELAVYVMPSDKIMSPKGFPSTAFILGNSRHQLTST